MHSSVRQPSGRRAPKHELRGYVSIVMDCHAGTSLSDPDDMANQGAKRSRFPGVIFDLHLKARGLVLHSAWRYVAKAKAYV